MFKWQSLALDVPSLEQVEKSNNEDAREFLGLLRTYERAKKQSDGADNDNEIKQCNYYDNHNYRNNK